MITTADSQQPVIKMLASGPAARAGRMNKFKKKDLYFILAGLAVLFLPPVLQRLAGNLGGGDDDAQPRSFSRSYGGPRFDDDAEAYAPSVNDQVPGFLYGAGTNGGPSAEDARGSSSGSGEARRVSADPYARSTRALGASAALSHSEMKDALAASARGANAAAKAAAGGLLMPAPRPALGGMVLHGLGAITGGAGASAGPNTGGGPISSANLVSGKASVGGGLTGARPPSGYAGIAGVHAPGAGGHDEYESLKKAADEASLGFNKSRAGAALAKASEQSLDFLRAVPPGGGAGAGAAAGAAKDKPDAGSVDKAAKNIGDSLAFQKQKEMQKAQIALWAKEQEAGDNKLEALKIRNSMLESFFGSLGKVLSQGIGTLLGVAPPAPSPSTFSSPPPGSF